jgi:ribonuclease BN (tRNA processing enzyme)
LDLSFYEYQSNELPVGDKVFKAWQVEHSPPSNPHAVRLEWNSKVIAFSGDTSWTDHLLPLSENADVFICECNFLNKVSLGHLSYAEIMDRFSDFNTRQLWLTHMDEEVIEADAFKLNRLSDGQIISI